MKNGNATGPGLIAALAMLGIATSLIFAPACGRKGAPDTFAKCLAAKQVTLYGLYWCGHCADQKKMFGPSFQYVPYVECGIEGSRSEQQVCIEAGVKNFPTWKLPDGSLNEGVKSLKYLSEKSGCNLE